MPIARWEATERFLKDYRALPAEIQTAVDEVLRQLVPWPTAKKLRHHTLNGYKPPIHKVDVTSNHAYQVTFRVEGDVARLLRVSTHKTIDRAPI